MCDIKPTIKKRYVRKVILTNGYAVDVHDNLSDGSKLITLQLANRTIFYDVQEKYIHKQRYRSNPIFLEKSKTYYKN